MQRSRWFYFSCGAAFFLDCWRCVVHMLAGHAGSAVVMALAAVWMLFLARD